MEGLISLLLSTFRVSTPLIFTGMGGLMSERAGVINIALEGLMLVGAFAGAAAASHFHSPWLGALVGMLAGIGLSAIYGLFVIHLKSDQIVAGTAINLLAMGAVPLASKALFDSTGATPSLEMSDRFQSEPLFMALFVVIAIHYWLKHSRLGLWITFAGEHPEALSTAGISVRRTRWAGVLLSGALAGLGGVTLSIFLSSSYSRGMTAGRGFMALAALIFGKWKPVPTLLACLFFGLTDALQIRLQGVAIFGDSPIPVQFIQILPYLVTVIILAGFIGKSRSPGSLGQPWMIFAIVGLGGLGLSGCAKLESAVNDAKVRFGITKKSVSAAPLTLEQENAEIFQEMVRVVFEREMKDPEIFGSYVNSLNQGASLEGIYNGLTHSAMYRGVEEKSPQASPEAVKFFAAEFAAMQAKLAQPIAVSARTASPLPTPEFPTGEEKPSSVHLSGTPKKITDVAAAQAEYEKVFANANIYTLKRLLADAVVQYFDETFRAKQPDSSALMKWYGEFAERMAKLKIDFGLIERNRADAKFHTDWAMRQMAQSRRPGMDLILWETLNRIHRVFNHYKGRAS